MVGLGGAPFVGSVGGLQGAALATQLPLIISQLDGYYKNPEIKIPFSQEAKNVEDKLRALGLGSEVDKAVESLNRAAEDAASEAKDIFGFSCIFKMPQALILEIESSIIFFHIL